MAEFQRTTRHYIPEDKILHKQIYENRNPDEYIYRQAVIRPEVKMYFLGHQ
jgi:hypothetical protein